MVPLPQRGRYNGQSRTPVPTKPQRAAAHITCRRQIYSLWRMPLRVYCATHFTHLTVSRHGAIHASVLVSKLPDTLSLDYHSRREYQVIEDNISRAIGTYLRLSLRFVPPSHLNYSSFIIHYSFSVSASQPHPSCFAIHLPQRGRVNSRLFRTSNQLSTFHFQFSIGEASLSIFHFQFAQPFFLFFYN